MHSRNHSFLGGRELLQGIICYILPKASLTHEQLTVPPASMKMGSKGGARGEVSRQGSGHGSKWCPGYPPGLPFSEQWGSSSIVVVFSAVSWDPSMHHWLSHNHSQGQGERCLAWKKIPLVFTLFSPYILWLGLYLLNRAIFFWWEKTQTGGSSR